MKHRSPSTADAAQLLTTLSLRPDLSSRLSDEHLALVSNYQRVLSLVRRKEQLEGELATLRREADRASELLQSRVSSARFSLHAWARATGTAGKAA